MKKAWRVLLVMMAIYRRRFVEKWLISFLGTERAVEHDEGKETENEKNRN